MRWEQLCKLASTLPGVTVDTWYGTPAFKVRGKGFGRLKEDGANVVFLLDSIDAQEALIEAVPAIYFITDHYKGHPAVLARLAELSPTEAMERLEHAWRQKAGPALIAAHEREPATAAATKRSRRQPATTLRDKPSAKRTRRRPTATTVGATPGAKNPR